MNKKQQMITLELAKPVFELAKSLNSAQGGYLADEKYHYNLTSVSNAY